MGHGIAQTAAAAGFPVLLYDSRDTAITHGIERIRWSLEKLKSRVPDLDTDAVTARIRPATLADAASASVVIEAIVEDAAVKEAFFHEVDAVAPAEAIFCSNSSAIPISRLAAATRRADRFCGMHFFAPVPLMKLVEVIRGLETSDATVASITGLARQFGKEPVEVKRDIAGFVVNRILIAAALEAVRVLEAGVADAAAIDEAMRLGCGYKMGPLETMDLSGIDVFVHAADAIYEDTGDPKYKSPALLTRMLAAGHLGRKSGRGFYSYPKA